MGSGCGGSSFFMPGWDGGTVGRASLESRCDCPGNHWIFDSLRGAPPRRPGRTISQVKQKGDIPAETPQHYHHTTLPNNCQLSVCEKLRILCFTPKFRKLFVLFPVLRNALKYGRLMVRKKVIPDMVSTPAGWAFKIFRFT